MIKGLVRSEAEGKLGGMRGLKRGSEGALPRRVLVRALTAQGTCPPTPRWVPGTRRVRTSSGTEQVSATSGPWGVGVPPSSGLGSPQPPRGPIDLEIFTRLIAPSWLLTQRKGTDELLPKSSTRCIPCPRRGKGFGRQEIKRPIAFDDDEHSRRQQQRSESCHSPPRTPICAMNADAF